MESPPNPIVAAVVGVLTTVVGLVVGLGALGTEEGHIIVSSVGTILGAGIALIGVVLHAVHRKAVAIERAGGVPHGVTAAPGVAKNPPLRT